MGNPSPTESNGPAARDPRGRFGRGNRFAKGNPLARRAAAFRSELYHAVTRADVRAVAKKLIAEARAGEPWAVRELFDRLLGKPIEVDILSRIEELEQRNGIE